MGWVGLGEEKWTHVHLSVSLIYRTETTTKKCKTEKVKTDMLLQTTAIAQVLSIRGDLLG